MVGHEVGGDRADIGKRFGAAEVGEQVGHRVVREGVGESGIEGEIFFIAFGEHRIAIDGKGEHRRLAELLIGILVWSSPCRLIVLKEAVLLEDAGQRVVPCVEPDRPGKGRIGEECLYQRIGLAFYRFGRRHRIVGKHQRRRDIGGGIVAATLGPGRNGEGERRGEQVAQEAEFGVGNGGAVPFPGLDRHFDTGIKTIVEGLQRAIDRLERGEERGLFVLFAGKRRYRFGA